MALWGNKDTATVTGTIGIPNGSSLVTGASTTFGTDVLVNDILIIAGVKYQVRKINSTTSLNLNTVYEGTTIASGATITKQQGPKYLQSLTDLRNTVFVSQEEAVLKTNKDKGITGAGWWLSKSYTDADGKIRYKSELLIAITAANATSGDAADDAIVADAEVTITVTTQPTNQTTISGGATFGITASVSSGTLTYQWQKKPVAVTGRWANVAAAATSATLALTGQLAGNTGDQYRVIMQSSSGVEAVTSTAATLTFGT